MTNENNLNLTEMTRDKLLFSICPMDMKYDCCNADSNLNCDYCNRLLNKWLDEYDKQIRAKAIDEFAEKAIKIVYDSNDRDRNPQPRDMVADIHYKLMDLAKLLKEQNK